MNERPPRNLLGLALVVLGAVAMAIAAFLPFAKPAAEFVKVSDNMLVQHGGWLLLVAAVGIVAGGYGLGRGKWGRWVLILALGFAAVLVVVYANDEGLRSLYPVGSGGATVSNQPGGIVADLGIAIYVAAAGLAAAVIGTVVLLLPAAAARTRKT